MPKNWKKEFDKKWEEVYCVECLKGSWKRDAVKSFIENLLAVHRKNVLIEAAKVAEIELASNGCFWPAGSEPGKLKTNVAKAIGNLKNHNV